MLNYNRHEQFGFTKIETSGLGNYQYIDTDEENAEVDPNTMTQPVQIYTQKSVLPVQPLIKNRRRECRLAHRSFQIYEGRGCSTDRFTPNVKRFDTSGQGNSRDHNPLEELGTDRTKIIYKSKASAMAVNQSMLSAATNPINTERFRQYIAGQRKSRHTQPFKERLVEQSKALNSSENEQFIVQKNTDDLPPKPTKTPIRKKSLALQTTGRESSDEKELHVKRMIFKNLEVETKHELAQQIIEIINENERRLQTSDAKLNVYLEKSQNFNQAQNCLQLIDCLRNDWKARLLNISRMLELINLRGTASLPQNLLETVFKTPKSLSKTVDFTGKTTQRLKEESTKATLKQI